MSRARRLLLIALALPALVAASSAATPRCTPLPVTPEDACLALESTYPDSVRTCLRDADCDVVMHQYNCCSSHYAWGIRADAVAAFDRAEAACVAQMPQCGCPAFPPVADDGNSSTWGPEGFSVRCQEGACFSFVP